jgi:hypothetical protein
MIAYSSWKENQIKIIEGKEIIDSYNAIRDRYVGYFKNPKTGEAVEVPRTDIISTVCSNFGEELVKRLKNGGLNPEQAQNVVAFLLDTPVENAYATLLPLKSVPEFSTDSGMRDFVLENKELCDKIREAKKAKEAYLTAKEERENKKKKKEDEVPF